MRLVAADWYQIPGRGWVAVFAGIDGFNPRPLTGQTVEIDGRCYVVRGVETRMIPDPSGHPFGLLVDGGPS